MSSSYTVWAWNTSSCMDDAHPCLSFYLSILNPTYDDYDCVRELWETEREREGWTQVTTAWPPGERKNWQKWRLMNIPGIKPESPHSSQGELEGGRNWFLVQNCSFRCKSKLLSMPLSIKVRTDNWSDASSLPVCEVWVARIKLVPCIHK